MSLYTEILIYCGALVGSVMLFPVVIRLLEKWSDFIDYWL